MSHRFIKIIENEEFGFHSYCPELEGCQIKGKTLDETLNNMEETIELYLEMLMRKKRLEFLVKILF
ncbi:MAG: type II toxin-antitoxin system HicB family antitoxin [Syntrophothermus sp.]